MLWQGLAFLFVRDQASKVVNDCWSSLLVHKEYSTPISVCPCVCLLPACLSASLFQSVCLRICLSNVCGMAYILYLDTPHWPQNYLRFVFTYSFCVVFSVIMVFLEDASGQGQRHCSVLSPAGAHVVFIALHGGKPRIDSFDAGHEEQLQSIQRRLEHIDFKHRGEGNGERRAREDSEAILTPWVWFSLREAHDVNIDFKHGGSDKERHLCKEYGLLKGKLPVLSFDHLHQSCGSQIIAQRVAKHPFPLT